MLLHAFVAISCLAGPMPEADQIFLDAALPGVVLGPGTDEEATAAWLPLERRTQLGHATHVTRHRTHDTSNGRTRGQH